MKLSIPESHPLADEPGYLVQRRCPNCLGRGWFGRGGVSDARRMCGDCIGLGYVTSESAERK